MRTNHILFVVVIYNIPLTESKSYLTLLEQDGVSQADIFVFDNSPYQQKATLTVGKYVSDPSNGGLSKAYNCAAEYAQSHGYKWLLILDQDTTFPANALCAYQKAMAEHPDVEMIVPQHRISTGQYMSPTKYCMKTSHLQDTVPTGMVSFKDAAPINSGMLVSVASFVKAGGYDEQVWLDFSDIRFIEKYQRHYTHFYVMPDVVCTQNFSATDTDPERIFKRFRIYLSCAANYPKDSFADALAMFITTLRPTLSRTLKTRSMCFLQSWWNIYIRRKQTV